MVNASVYMDEVAPAAIAI